MKPDWSKAPDWANFLTMDFDGTWVWWAEEPSPRSQDWSGGRYAIADPTWDTDWLCSMERRP